MGHIICLIDIHKCWKSINWHDWCKTPQFSQRTILTTGCIGLRHKYTFSEKSESFILGGLVWLPSPADNNTNLDLQVNYLATHYCWGTVYFSAKKCSRSDWGSNLRPSATPPCTKYQHSNPLWAKSPFLKKKGSLDSGIQSWYLSTRHVANTGELLYTQLNSVYYSESGDKSISTRRIHYYILICAQRGEAARSALKATRVCVGQVRWSFVNVRKALGSFRRARDCSDYRLDRIEAFYVVMYSCDVTEVKNNNPGGLGGLPPTYELLRASQVIDFSYYFCEEKFQVRVLGLE
jgi:hypothetical protein